jgi:hypothetical protein
MRAGEGVVASGHQWAKSGLNKGRLVRIPNGIMVYRPAVDEPSVDGEGGGGDRA